MTIDALLYCSRYANLVLAGVTGAGERFALVAGKHGPQFPYDTPESEWDQLLLLCGDERLIASARTLPELTIDLSGEGPVRGSGALRFEGTMRRVDGGDARVSLHVALDMTRFEALLLGGLIPGLDVRLNPGLRWQPSQLIGVEGCQSVTIDGEPRRIEASSGEIEHGEMTGIVGSRLAVVYDYVCLAPADTREPYAYVDFVSHALRPTGLLGRALEHHLVTNATAKMTLLGGEKCEGNVKDARTDGLVVVLSDKAGHAVDEL